MAPIARGFCPHPRAGIPRPTFRAAVLPIESAAARQRLSRGEENPMRSSRPRAISFVFALALFLTLPAFADPTTVANPICTNNTVSFNPDQGQDIVVPPGFRVSVFATGLNFPTGIAVRGNQERFEVYVLESGHVLPSRCNDAASPVLGGHVSPPNPFTPDIRVCRETGHLIRPLAKPTAGGGGLLAHGPSVDLGFERGFAGGRLFATDSNQSLRTPGFNNSSRIVIVDPNTGQVTPFITGLPTGDHPTEQLAFKGNHIYWSQGSTTNSGVVGRDNRNGANQPDIPCQEILLNRSAFDSAGGVKTSGYSPFGVQRPGATVKAFESALHPGGGDAAILRAKLNAAHPDQPIQPSPLADPT